MNKKKEKQSIIQKLFFNNKYLMVFCLVISVILWAAVKINYSDDTVRTISDIKISLNANTEETEYTAFFDEDELIADVEITGKAYNINAYALSKDDIIVETSNIFIDSAGYKTLVLTARISEAAAASGVEVTKISPSTVTVYYDKLTTDTFNVIARINEDSDKLVNGSYIVGQPVPSLNTVDVSGPATILSEMKNVYFDAIISGELPLLASAEFPAEVTYGIDTVREMKFLNCLSVNSQTNPATVTIPVYVQKEVPVTVKFVNEPGVYSENHPSYVVSPSVVTIVCNPKDEAKYTELNIGTIDFSKLDNTLNTFEIALDREKFSVKILDNELEKFRVEVDMSKMETVTFSYTDANVLFLNKQDGFNYSLSDGGNINAIKLVGPKKSINKLTADNIQVEINVAALNASRSSSQLLPVNISINNEAVNDCWVYGEYTAYVTAAVSETEAS